MRGGLPRHPAGRCHAGMVSARHSVRVPGRGVSALAHAGGAALWGWC